MLNLDGDLPRHLLTGRYILETHIIPTTELFIYPYLNQSYVPHEWLTDVIFSLLYSQWGLTGIVVLSAFLMAVTFTVLYNMLSNKLNLRLSVLLLVAWGAIATSLNWAARPHLISMCLLAIWLTWADDLRRNEKSKIWRFPALMLIWGNLHGEFITGILVLFAYIVGWVLDYLFDRSNANLNIGKNISLAFILSTLASLINPSGIGPWVNILGFINNPYLMSRMAEAGAPSFQDPDMRVFFSLLIFSVFLLAVKKDTLPTGQGLALTGFSLMGLAATRNIHFYGIVAPFVLAETLDKITSIPWIGRIEFCSSNY